MNKTARKKMTIDSELMRRKLKLKQLETKNRFSEKFPEIEAFFKKKGIDPGKVREHSAKMLGAGAVAGALFIAPTMNAGFLPPPSEILKRFVSFQQKKTSVANPNKFLASTLSRILPEKVRPLGRNEEKLLEQLFINIVGIPARATLEGEHLNTTYGLIGAEQHLRRYPGDTLLQHGTGQTLNEGIAPGLGAWRYFAPSKSKMTNELKEIEKWYAVVQTLYLPDWNTRTRYLREWYKYRKVLIVNTENGNAVVASIADSGPAAWTGKHFGGSPEVMDYLGGSRYKKGPVVIFFVDDPENKIPLGPVNYKGDNIPMIPFNKA
jgi:hypothetical protein